MIILAYLCDEAPAAHRWMANPIEYDAKGKAKRWPLVFYRPTREEAVAAAQADWDEAHKPKRPGPGRKKADAAEADDFGGEAI